MSTDSVSLQLDMGNSSAKWRLVADDSVLARGRYRSDDRASREALLDLPVNPSAIWVASVASARAESELASLLQERWGVAPWFARTAARAGDLVNSYANPERMGVDRWLAMRGARQRSRQPLCVIDAGSALTIDLVAADGQHEGGYIIPGANLMERALLLDTDRVRFDDDVGFALNPGKSTAEAVRHGIALAQVGAVATALSRCSADYDCFVCGGGSHILEILEQVPAIPFDDLCWVPDLVFEGLHIAARDIEG